MSTVPNYVGTSSEVQGNNDVEVVGSNVQTKLAPKNVHYEKPATLPSLFVTPVPKNRLELAQEDGSREKEFQEAQDQLFEIWPKSMDASVQNISMEDRPSLSDLEPNDPFMEYTTNMLQHNALFQLKIMRGPS